MWRKLFVECSLEGPTAFRYRDRGAMAIIGRASAVADLGKLQFSAFGLACLAFVHLMQLVEFEIRSRFDSVGLVLLQPQSRCALDHGQRLRQRISELL
jgi:NADH dehydrogenase